MKPRKGYWKGTIRNGFVCGRWGDIVPAVVVQRTILGNIPTSVLLEPLPSIGNKSITRYRALLNGKQLFVVHSYTPEAAVKTANKLLNQLYA